jgi:excisionase family DNA binding protein
MNLAEEFFKLEKRQEQILQMMKGNRMRSEQQLKVYTLNQVAKVFNVTVRTIYNWKDQGILPCTVVGSKTYLTEAQLQKFLAEHEVKPVMRGRVA